MNEFQLTNPFHVGYIVADIAAAMSQMSCATGVTWHPPQVFPVDIQVKDVRSQFEVKFTYSKEGPVQIEVAEGPRGTPWDAVEHGGVSHMGYWSSDLKSDVERLVAADFSMIYAGVGNQPGPSIHAMLVSPTGMRVEFIDTIMQPAIEAWYKTGKLSLG